MEKSRFSLHQTFVSALIVVGAVAVCAISFNYAGTIQLRLGADGLQLQVDGVEKNE